LDLCPEPWEQNQYWSKCYVSIDGKYLFYCGKKKGIPGILWDSLKIIEELKPKE